MPTTIGRYEIIRELGKGGMAVVYLARDPNVDRSVVVKVIQSQHGGDPEFNARFRREARLIANLEHEAIVPIYDFGEHDGQPFIVMRHMTGGTLADRLERGPLPLPELARLVERIADALDHAHGKGIIHRDLKPGNILFDERGKAYLSDFGIAKAADATTKLTGTGIIGTPAYMSPEQARAVTELDRRSDVYSLGVMVFETLTGELPFKAGNATGLLLAHVNDPVPDIRKTRPDLPREADSLIKRAMAKQPESRYATTLDLAVELSKIATKPSGKPRPAAGPKPVEKPKTPTPGPDDQRPTGVMIEPKRLVGQFGKLPYIVPIVLIGLCALAALLAGIFAVPGLLTQRTPTAQPTNIVAITPNNPTTQPTKTSTPNPRPSNTPTRTPVPTTPAPTPTPTLGIGSTQVSEKDGMVMVFVPAGEFTMGSDDGNSDEQPVHTVWLDDFWIDQTEVTGAMFAMCVEAGACSLDGIILPDKQNHPMTEVTWYGANAYCKWAGRRLPTEAEWEKAARGTDRRTYPWGDNAPDAGLLNFNNNIGDTTEVGSYPSGASPYGALDMAGNVWEWVADWYDENYYGISPSENPTGPVSGDYKVLRGGGWSLNVSVVRAADRYRGVPSNRSDDLGFRCVSSP